VTKLTRGNERSITPKLLTFAEKEAARIKLERDMEEFFARDGFIREIPQGESAISKPASPNLKKSVPISAIGSSSRYRWKNR
jgi:hypothetical protein